MEDSSTAEEITPVSSSQKDTLIDIIDHVDNTSVSSDQEKYNKYCRPNCYNQQSKKHTHGWTDQTNRLAIVWMIR